MFDQFQQNPQAVGDSLTLSALCALIPLAVLFVLLGGLKVRAWISGLIALGEAFGYGDVLVVSAVAYVGVVLLVLSSRSVRGLRRERVPALTG